MKKIYTIIFHLILFSTYGQNYYYNGSEKIIVYESKNSFVSYDKPSDSFELGYENVETFSAKGFSILEGEKTNFYSIKFRDEELKQTIPALIQNSESSFKMFPTKTIRVKTKNGKTKVDILNLFKNNEIQEINEKYGILRIKIRDIHSILDIANRIYEAKIAEFSIPDFYIPIEINQVSDPLFPLQFQMNNTGQTINGIQGVNDIDSNAFEAWGISMGDDITVAVVDQGLENHEDFGNRLIGGFTPATNGNGNPILNNDTHGMNCAGIIGASDDNLGLRGIAPNVDFLSVNIFANGTTAGDISDGIIWAADNGADVISNSWGYNSCTFSSPDINNAINYAITNGRNGKGSIVVFSSGNSGGCVNYPARNNNVISVGAIDNRGNLFNYSSRGAELDLVAPSGQTNYLGNVRTTDRMGNAGRVAGNYEPSFGGTSASCPVVSGVVALVLSVNPNLTQKEVRDILNSTATDMGTVGFDNNFGYGRVNAYAAVQMAQSYSNATLESVETICYSPKTINLSNNDNNPVAWQTSSNVSIVSQSNSAITIKAINTSVNGEGWVKATLSNGIILQENFWVGVPSTQKISIIKSGAVRLTENTWNIIHIIYDNKFPHLIQGIELTDWQWRMFPSPGTSIMSRLGTGSMILLRPTTHNGYVDFQSRVCNECGYSGWKSKIFQIGNSSVEPDGPPGLEW